MSQTEPGLALVRGLYAILDLDPGQGTVKATALAKAVLAAGVSVVQLRMKRTTSRALLETAQALRPLAAAAGALLVVNDRLDVALLAGADGVHLGQDDLPQAAARQAEAAARREAAADGAAAAQVEATMRGASEARPTLLIGVSTHNLAQARAAVAAGADYLGFGPVFATTSKQRPDPVTGLAALHQAVREVACPVVAIGGIDLTNIEAVARTGVAAAACIGALRLAADPGAAAEVLARAFARGARNRGEGSTGRAAHDTGGLQ